MNGRHDRSSVAGSKIANRVFTDALRSVSLNESSGRMSRNSTSSTRRGGVDGSNSLKPWRVVEPMDHGSPAAGIAMMKFPPRSVHCVSARVDSSESLLGRIAPLAHTTASNIA